MKFPDRKAISAADHGRGYGNALAKVRAELDFAQIEAASSLLARPYRERRPVPVCGNGGSAAIANHLGRHVPIDNYGIAEDAHQSVMHVLAQYIRQSHMKPDQARAAIF